MRRDRFPFGHRSCVTLVGVGLLLALGCAPRPEEPAPRADYALLAAVVHTLTDSPAVPPPRAVLVGGDRVLAVGGEELRSRAPRVLPAGHVYPGFTDAHGHLHSLGLSLENVDLTGTTTYADVIERVRARAATLPAGTWVLGRGWDQNDWPPGPRNEREFPDHRALSQALPDHPVFLTRIDGHAALANASAMRMAAVDRSSPDPAGGKVHRFPDGEPTGVLIDRAMALVGGSIPVSTREDVRRRYLAAQAACFAVGLTSVHDAGVSPSDLPILEELESEGLWHLRVYVMLSASARDTIRRGPWRSKQGLIVARAVKGSADGALGSRGAALLEPYSDDPRNRGLALMSPRELLSLATLCRDANMQLNVHAIGDQAVRSTLDAYAAARAAPSSRWRIEHAQVVSPPDFPRFVSLGVIPSMQPTHCTSDMPWAPARLGPRVEHAYAWRTFLDLGLPIPCGSDFPIESHDPRKGLFAATTTRPELPPYAPPFRPDQRMTRREALLGFTRWPAFAAFEEEHRGHIAAGVLADFTVFDRDLETCPERELLAARVLLTVIGGRIAYQAD